MSVGGRSEAGGRKGTRAPARTRFAVGVGPGLLPKLLPDGLKSGRSGQHRPTRRSKKPQVRGTVQHQRSSMGTPQIGVQVPPRPRVLAGQWAAVRPGEVGAVRAGVRRPVDRHGGREAVVRPDVACRSRRGGVGGGVGPLRRALQSGLARPAVAAARRGEGGSPTSSLSLAGSLRSSEDAVRRPFVRRSCAA